MAAIGEQMVLRDMSVRQLASDVYNISPAALRDTTSNTVEIINLIKGCCWREGRLVIPSEEGDDQEDMLGGGRRKRKSRRRRRRKSKTKRRRKSKTRRRRRR